MDGPVSAGHVCLLARLDDDVAPEELFHQISARLHLAPILRRRLRMPTLPMGRPWWIDDISFDLDRHLSAVDLGGSADDAALHDEVARYATEQLPRDRPLWHLRLVRGLAGRRGAMVTKMHHCAVDGVGGRDLLALLFGTDIPPDSPAPSWTPGDGPGRTERFAHRVTDVSSWVASAWRLEGKALGVTPSTLLRVTRQTAASFADGLERLIEHEDRPTPIPEATRMGPAPQTPFNAAISADRAFATVTFPLAASRRLRRSTGVTANDVLLASCAGALRSWLAARDALPQTPLIALVPIAISGDLAAGGFNRFTLTLCPLPTHVGTARGRLAFSHAAMQHAKREPTIPSTTLTDIAAVTGPGLASLLTQAAAQLHLADRVHLPFNLMISNVPAPAQRLSVGRRAAVLGTHPFPPLVDGLGLTICAQGYAGGLDVGVASCATLVPDPSELRDLLAAAHDELIELE